jgi:hypothetical protein
MQAARTLELPKQKLKSIYKQIDSILTSESLSPAEFYQLGLYYSSIKKILLDNPKGESSVVITLHTNIDPDNYSALSDVLSELDRIAESSNTRIENRHIEIRRNTPPWIDVSLADSVIQLASYLKAVYDTFAPIIGSTADIIAIVGLGKVIQDKVQRKHDSQLNSRRVAQESTILKQETITPEGITNIKTLRDDLNSLSRRVTKQESIGVVDSSSQRQNENRSENHLISRLADRNVAITKIDIQFFDVGLDTLEKVLQQTFQYSVL